MREDWDILIGFKCHIWLAGMPQFLDFICVAISSAQSVPRLRSITQIREYKLKGSITVWRTSGLFCFDSAALLMMNEQQFYLFGKIQTSQTGGQPYSDTSPYGDSVSVTRLGDICKFLATNFLTNVAQIHGNFQATVKSITL